MTRRKHHLNRSDSRVVLGASDLHVRKTHGNKLRGSEQESLILPHRSLLRRLATAMMGAPAKRATGTIAFVLIHKGWRIDLAIPNARYPRYENGGSMPGSLGSVLLRT